MTLEEAKDQFAATTVYKTWQNIQDELDGTSEYIDYLHEVAELYARSKWDEACSLQKQNCWLLYMEHPEIMSIQIAAKPEFKP